jgi:hypothetical protein
MPMLGDSIACDCNRIRALFHKRETLQDNPMP